MVNFQMAYFTYASAVWQMVSLKRPVNGRKTEFFVDQTAKNTKNAETADKRDAGLLLGREIFHRFSFAFSAFFAVEPI